MRLVEMIFTFTLIGAVSFGGLLQIKVEKSIFNISVGEV
jgi:hypothetical protein